MRVTRCVAAQSVLDFGFAGVRWQVTVLELGGNSAVEKALLFPQGLLLQSMSSQPRTRRTPQPSRTLEDDFPELYFWMLPKRVRDRIRPPQRKPMKKATAMKPTRGGAKPQAKKSTKVVRPKSKKTTRAVMTKVLKDESAGIHSSTSVAELSARSGIAQQPFTGPRRGLKWVAGTKMHRPTSGRSEGYEVLSKPDASR